MKVRSGCRSWVVVAPAYASHVDGYLHRSGHASSEQLRRYDLYGAGQYAPQSHPAP